MKIIYILLFSLVNSFLIFSQTGSFTDIRDGRVYRTTTIGYQIWMGDNLMAVTFRNGDPIPNASTSEAWESAKKKGKPAWCYYDNRSVQDDPINGNKYGILYNWYAVSDPRGLAPEGWHIASDAEWTTLANQLGGKELAGIKLKSENSWGVKSYIGWQSNFTVNCGGDNSSGINALPGGYCHNGIFLYLGAEGRWWSSTETVPFSKKNKTSGRAIFFQLLECPIGDPDRLKTQEQLFRGEDVQDDGYSVRCVKN